MAQSLPDTSTTNIFVPSLLNLKSFIAPYPYGGPAFGIDVLVKPVPVAVLMSYGVDMLKPNISLSSPKYPTVPSPLNVIDKGEKSAPVIPAL